MTRVMAKIYEIDNNRDNLIEQLVHSYVHVVSSLCSRQHELTIKDTCKEQGPLHIRNTLLSRDVFNFIERMKVS